MINISWDVVNQVDDIWMIWYKDWYEMSVVVRKGGLQVCVASIRIPEADATTSFYRKSCFNWNTLVIIPPGRSTMTPRNCVSFQLRLIIVGYFRLLWLDVNILLLVATVTSGHYSREKRNLRASFNDCIGIIAFEWLNTKTNVAVREIWLETFE